MNTHVQSLHCLLLPLSGFRVALPQPAIAEIVSHRTITQIRGASDWLSGVIEWRGRQVSLISFEKLCGEASGAAQRTRYIAVLHALDDALNLTYYGIELQAIPHPALLTPACLAVGMARSDGNGAIAADVLIDGERAIIPALERIEQLLAEQLAAAPDSMQITP